MDSEIISPDRFVKARHVSSIEFTGTLGKNIAIIIAHGKWWSEAIAVAANCMALYRSIALVSPSTATPHCLQELNITCLLSLNWVNNEHVIHCYEETIYVFSNEIQADGAGQLVPVEPPPLCWV